MSFGIKWNRLIPTVVARHVALAAVNAHVLRHHPVRQLAKLYAVGHFTFWISLSSAETKPLNFGLRRPVLSLANHRSPSTGDVIGNNSLLTSPFFFVIYLVIYLVWPHQSCWSTCAAIGLVGHQSSKKPIQDCFSHCRPFLKVFTVLAFTVWWSNLFHLLTSRSVKKCRLTSNLLLCLFSFNSWPLRCFVVENSNIDSIGIPERPLTILNTSMGSALLRLSSKLQSPKRSV